MLDRRQVLIGAAALSLTGAARAQDYPRRTVKIIYNFSAGGPGDAAARYLAEQMGNRLGQQVVVDNRTGANGSIGILAAARAAADGYTLLFTTLPGVVQLPYTIGDKSFDPVKSLQQIGIVGASPLVILAHPSVPADDFPGFMKWARTESDPVQMAGAGPIIELSMAKLAQEAGLKLQFIPFRGSAPAIQAVLAGELKFYFMPPSAMTTELVNTGKLKVIGVTSATPSRLVPGGEPIAQQVPGYVQEILYSMWVPPGTPADVSTRIGQVMKEVSALPETADKLFAFGIESRYGGSEDLTRATLRESENIRKILATTPVKFGQ